MFLVLLEALGIVLGTATLGFAGWLFSTKKGRARGRKIRAWGKRQRKSAGRKIVRTGKAALGERKRRKLATPKGQQRARRKAQPHRLTVGHVRAADDPHPARVVARKVGAAVSKARKARKVKKLNRPARPSLATRGAGLWALLANGSAKPATAAPATVPGGAEGCLAKNADGTDCGNLEELDPTTGEGTGACYIGAHKRQVAQMGAKQEPWANGRQPVRTAKLRSNARDKQGSLRPGETAARKARGGKTVDQKNQGSFARDAAQRPVIQRRSAPKAQSRRDDSNISERDMWIKDFPTKPAPAGPSRVDAGGVVSKAAETVKAAPVPKPGD